MDDVAFPVKRRGVSLNNVMTIATILGQDGRVGSLDLVQYDPTSDD